MRVICQNMSIGNGDAARRYADLAALMLELRPNLLLVQEVCAHVGRPALEDLTRRRGPGHELRYAAVYPGQEDEQGVALISSAPIRRSYVTQLRAAGNQIQIAELTIGGVPLVVANVHLEVPGLNRRALTGKLNELADVLRREHPGCAQIVAGDFNAPPLLGTVRALTRGHGFTSACKSVHGVETATFPTLTAEELLTGRYVKPNELRRLLKVGRLARALGRRPTDLARYTTDYVLFKGLAPPTAFGLIGTGRDARAPLSDHAGLAVTFPTP